MCGSLQNVRSVVDLKGRGGIPPRFLFCGKKTADPDIKALLDRYNLPGLSGYVILRTIK